MAENFVVLDSKNFDKMIAKGNWVVDFWASWCGPCKIMAPHFEAAAKELKGKVNFGKVDAEQQLGQLTKMRYLQRSKIFLSCKIYLLRYDENFWNKYLNFCLSKK